MQFHTWVGLIVDEYTMLACCIGVMPKQVHLASQCGAISECHHEGELTFGFVTWLLWELGLQGVVQPLCRAQDGIDMSSQLCCQAIASDDVNGFLAISFVFSLLIGCKDVVDAAADGVLIFPQLRIIHRCATFFPFYVRGEAFELVEFAG